MKGLVDRLREEKVKGERRATIIRNVALFVLRRLQYNELKTAARGVVSDETLEWIHKGDYCLTVLRRGIHRTVKFGHPSRRAWKWKVKRTDIVACIANLDDETKASLRKEMSWSPMPRANYRDMIRLLTPLIRTEVYRHLAFIWRHDSGLGPEDLQRDLEEEAVRVAKLYDFKPDFKKDEFRFTKAKHNPTVKLTAQPVLRVLYVKLNGNRKPLSTLRWSITNDKLTIHASMPVTLIEVMFSHYLKTLNYSRQSVVRRAHRLVEHHTAKCRQRIRREEYGGEVHYTQTCTSLEKPVGDSSTGEARMLHEQIPCKTSHADSTASIQRLAIQRTLLKLKDPALAMFAGIVTFSESAPAEFVSFCEDEKKKHPRDMKREELSEAAKSYLCLDEEDLDTLRSAILQANAS